MDLPHFATTLVENASSCFLESFEGLSPEHVWAQIAPDANPIAWMVGHCGPPFPVRPGFRRTSAPSSARETKSKIRCPCCLLSPTPSMPSSSPEKPPSMPSPPCPRMTCSACKTTPPKRLSRWSSASPSTSLSISGTSCSSASSSAKPPHGDSSQASSRTIAGKPWHDGTSGGAQTKTDSTSTPTQIQQRNATNEVDQDRHKNRLKSTCSPSSPTTPESTSSPPG